MIMGGNPAPVDMVNIPLFIGFQHHPKVVIARFQPSTVVLTDPPHFATKKRVLQKNLL